MCSGQFATLRFTGACVIPVLHALQVAEPTFLALKRSITGIFVLLGLRVKDSNLFCSSRFAGL